MLKQVQHDAFLSCATMSKGCEKTYMKVLLLFLFVIVFLQINTSAQVYNGGATLQSQAEVDAFTYTSITGLLVIQENTTGNITNLNGLSKLTSVGGYLEISSNSALTNLNGLSNLSSISGDLYFNSNNSLTNIDGLSNLASVGGLDRLVSNPALTNIDPLSNLSSVAGLEINNNDALTYLQFDNLTSVGVI